MITHKYNNNNNSNTLPYAGAKMSIMPILEMVRSERVGPTALVRHQQVGRPKRCKLEEQSQSKRDHAKSEHLS